MAYYVDSAGSNTSPYDTKAKAANLFSTIMAIDAAGDTIYIADTHTETPTGPISHACAGTASSPSKILCINFGTDALSTGAIIGSTTTLTLSGSFYCYGVTFKSGVGSSTANHNIIIGGQRTLFELCTFSVETTNATAYCRINSTTLGYNLRAEFLNCNFKFANAGHFIAVETGRIDIKGGGIASGSSAITKLFKSEGAITIYANVLGFDASLAATSVSVFGASGTSIGGIFLARNIKMPTSWSGALSDSAASNDFQIIGSNVGAVDANYYSASQSYAGKHINDNALYPSTIDGAEHNGSAVKQSYKVTTTANAKYPMPAFYLLEYPYFNTVTTSQTATVEIIHNEAANLTDAEVWLELEYLGTSGSSLSSFVSDDVANILATPSAQATSTADWDDGLTARANSTGYSVGNLIKVASNAGRSFICTASTGNSSASEPAGYATAVDGDSITDGSCTFKAMRRQKVNVTFTAAEQGPILARVAVARASAVVWVSAKLTVA